MSANDSKTGSNYNSNESGQGSARGQGRGSSQRKELTAAELSLFFANMELIYHSGLTPTDGFDILRQSSNSAVDKGWLSSLYDASVMGLSLTAALRQSGGMPDYALSLLKIGEETGKLEDTCASLHDYFARRDELAQALRAALVYPLTMIMMVFVVVLLALRLTPAGKRFFALLYEKAPITRELSFKTALQRFAYAMATMLRSGLDAGVALQLVEPLIEDDRAFLRISHIRRQVAKSVSLQTAIEESKLFDAEEMSLLSVGFRTGTDAQAFDQVGSSIAATTERRLDRLVGMLEPALVGLMCLLVGAILLSVMLPLLGVLSNI